MTTRTALLLQDLAAGVDGVLRDNFGEPMGFSILVWPRRQGQRVNYVSNVPTEQRAELIDAFEQLLARWKAGMPDIPANKVN